MRSELTELAGAPATCPDGEFVEAGAARVHPHMITMRYVRMLGLDLVPFLSRNDDARIEIGGLPGEVISQRDWWQDLYSAVVSPDIDRGHPHIAGRHQLLPHVTRRSLRWPEDVGDPTASSASPGQLRTVDELADARSGRTLLSDLSTLKSATQFAVAGGNARIAAALASRIGPAAIRLASPVDEIVVRDDGVSVRCAAGAGPPQRYHYAVVATPPHIAARIGGNLPASLRDALAVPEPRPAVKTFVTYASRWWETALGIYGGTSYPSDGPVDRLWYPSGAWTSGPGTLTAYSVKDNAAALDRMSRGEWAREVVATVARMHPDAPAAHEPIAVTGVSWSRVPYIEGAWVNWPDYYDHPAYHQIRAAAGPVVFAGDWLHPATAWMSGAFHSAAQAITRLVGHATSPSSEAFL